MSTEDIAKLRIRIEATTAKFEAALARTEKQLRQSSGKMGREAAGIDRRMSDVGKNFGINIPNRAAIAGTAILAVGVAIRAVIKEGERVKLIEGRFKALTGSAERANTLLRGTFDIASRTGGAVDDISGAVSRFTLAAEAIGASDQQVLEFTENVQKLGAIGGASVAEVTSGTLQLGQALASGRLQGDELRSIMENMPLVAKAIADGLGVGVGELKQMGADGELLASKIMPAILGQTEKINAQFAELPVTSGRAMGMIRAELTKSLSLIDDLTGASATWANVLTTVANIIGRANAALERGMLSTAQRRVDELKAEAARRQSGGSQVTGTPGVSAGGIPMPGSREAFDASRGAARADAGRLRDEIAKAERDLAALQEKLRPENPYIDPPERTLITPVDETVNGKTGGGGSKVTDAERAAENYHNLAEAIRAEAEALEFEISVAEMSDEQRIRSIANRERDLRLRDLQEEAARAGAATTDEERAAAEALADQVRDLTIARDEQARAIDETRRASEDAARSMDEFSGRIGDAILQSRSLNDVLTNLLSTLAAEAFQGIFQGTGAFAGLGSAIGGAVVGSGGATKLGGAGKKKFATGGRPNVGQISVVGENGPERFIADTPGRILSHADAKRAVHGGGGGFRVIINNNAPVSVSTQQGVDSGELIVVIDRITSQNIADPRSRTSRAMQSARQAPLARR